MPLQQPDVEESQHRRRGKKRRPKTSSSGRKRRKRRSHSKTRLENRGETTDYEQDKVSVHVQDDDDNVSVLLHDFATNDKTNSTDETLTNLGEMLEDVEATGDDITPKLATIAENRWNKKLEHENLTLIQEKYKRSANWTTVCSLTVNPEI